MAGVKLLRKVQLGRESTAGQEINATTIWCGSGMLEDGSEIKHAEEDIGYISGVDRTYIPKVMGKISLEQEATFEQILHPLEAGVETVSPVQDGAGTDYISTYTFPTTALNTIKTYTIEGGDNQQEEQMLYSFCEALKLSGKMGEALKLTSDWIGRQIAPGTFTAELSVPSVSTILMSKSKIYIDAVGGTIGTTQKSNTLLGIDLSIKTGWIPVFTGDGAIYFTFPKCVGPEITLDVTFEHDASSVAEKAACLAETPRLLRLLIEGPAVTTAGTVYSVKTLIIDLAGKWEKFSKIDEQDGNDIVTGTLRARYNATAAKFAEIVVVHELAAVP